MKILVKIRNFYPRENRRFNYFPILHLSIEKCDCKQGLLIEIGLLGVCHIY